MADVLVTGSRGFVGQHLLPLLLDQGMLVAGLSRHVGSSEGLEQHMTGDLTEPHVAEDALARFAPDVIVHLAGATGTASPKAMLDDNVLATINLLQAVRALDVPPRVVLAGSSAVYGASDQPLDESAPLQPASIYGLSKLAQELAAQQIAGTAVPLALARLFNLVGPGQSADFVLGKVARQIALAELGGPRRILVGNTATTRDFVDVRDAARAIALLAQQRGVGGPFNVATGIPQPIAGAIQLLLAHTECELEVSASAPVAAEGDVTTQTGNPGRLHEATGWSPLHSFEASLDALLDSWRAQARKEPPP